MEQAGHSRVDIAVIGGGMVGLSLLQLIAKYLPDCRACLIEAHAYNTPVARPASQQPSFDRRSTALARGSIDIFQQLGLWSAMQHKTTPITRVHVTDRGHLGSATYNAQASSAGENARRVENSLGCVIENAWLGQQLLRGLESANSPTDEGHSVSDSVFIVAPAHVSKLTPRRGCVTLQIEQQGKASELEAELVIVADGAASSTREALGIHVERTPYHQAAVIANVEFSEAHKGVAFERFTAQGPMALLPLGEALHARTSALVWTHPIAEVDRVLQWSDDEFLSQLQTAFGYRLGKFLRVSQRGSYPLELQQASEQIRSNIVLMGNAAHYLHPVAGQGFNLALRDCAQLIHVLQQARRQKQSLGSLAVLQEYLRKQENDQWLTTQLSHNFNRVFSNNQKSWQILRNIGLISLELCPPLKQQFFSQMMGTGQKQIQFNP
ncbi:2-octaprenyl-6-methoxyphenol hydroxylase [Thalassocella blandensis]|nr:2-octaprenyl-6-methoxyphenol hydroxylase [Thalassocella blandensis]